MTISSIYRNRWFPIVAGILVSPLLVRIAVAFVGAGDGSYLPAVVFFPWAMFLALLSKHITSFAFALGAIQWPMYGILLNPKARRFWSKVWTLLGCHASMLAFTLLWDREGLLRLW